MPTTQKRTNRVVRSDSRGRVQIGKNAIDKDFRVEYGDDGTIMLTPVVFIPENEAWLYENEEAIRLVRIGLREAAAGNVHDGAAFMEYSKKESE